MTDNVENMAAVVNNEMVGDRSVPWHGFGQFTNSLMSVEDVLTLVPELAMPIDILPMISPTTGEQTADCVEVVRRGDASLNILEKVLSMGMGAQYSTLDRYAGRALLEQAEAIVDVLPGSGFIDTAGTLMDGTKAFVCINLGDVADTVTHALGEAYTAYLLLSDSYNGTASLMAAIVFVRVVCTNTHAMALAGASNIFKVKHTKTVSERFENAQQALGLTTAYATEFATTLERMRAISVDLADITTFVENMIPVPEKRGADKANEERSNLEDNILHSNTVQNDLRGTAFGVFEAATEWSEHERITRWRGTTPDNEKRMRSSLLGGPDDKFRNKAFDLLLPVVDSGDKSVTCKLKALTVK